MATVQFKDPSPYVQKLPPAPVEDYLYTLYEKHVKAETPVGTEKKINLAIFGLGRAGTIHLSSLVRNPRVKILYVVDDDTSKHAKIKEYWGIEDVKFITSKQADLVYKDANVTTVIVASPTFTHEGVVKSALSANKAVFCEKPIAEDRESSQRCYQQAQQIGKPLFCAFNRRFDPSFNAVRDRVRSGEVGQVHTIKVCSRDSPLPSIDYLRTSGGIFHDCAVHDIDVMCWVLGEYPCKVSTIATAHVPEIKALNDFDTVAATLLFPSGTIGMIDLSRNSCYGYDQRLEVFGPRGMVRADNEQPMHCVDSQKGLQGINTAPIWFSFPSRYKLAYQYEMEHFFDIVQGKATTKVQGLETLAVSKIASACEESARSGKPIELTWAPNELPKAQ